MWSVERSGPIVLILVTLLSGGCTQAEPSTSATSQSLSVEGDVLDFHFDELATDIVFNDMSAENADGTCSGTQCPARQRLGLRGTPVHNNARFAAEFDGTNDCITIPDRAKHSISLPATFSMWIYPRSWGSAASMLSKYTTGGNNREWRLDLVPEAGGTLRFSFVKSSDGSAATTITRNSNVFDPDLDNNGIVDNWIHVVFQIDTSGAYRWFVNNVPYGTGTVPPTYKQGASITRIGCHSGGGFFDGVIDEILFTNADSIAPTSYASASDITSLYSWSEPTPDLVYLGTSDAVWNASGNIDVSALIGRLQDLGSQQYRFFLRWPSHGFCSGGCYDFAALRSLLKRLELLAIDIDITIEHNPFWHDFEPDGGFAADEPDVPFYDPTDPIDPADDLDEEMLDCKAIAAPHEKWACAIGMLAARYPTLLVGWNIDDLFADKHGQGGRDGYVPPVNPDINSFLDRRRLLEVCQEAHTHEASLALSGTIYCNHETDGFDSTFLVEWAQTCEVGSAGCTWDELFADYVKAFGENADDLSELEVEQLRLCLNGVTVYTQPVHLTNGATTINTCIANLNPLTVSEYLPATGVDAPSLRVDEGIYLTDFGVNCVGYDNERQDNIDVSRLTTPDGFVMYTMLPTWEAFCVSPNSADVDARIMAPAQYIDW